MRDLITPRVNKVAEELIFLKYTMLDEQDYISRAIQELIYLKECILHERCMPGDVVSIGNIIPILRGFQENKAQFLNTYELLFKLVNSLVSEFDSNQEKDSIFTINSNHESLIDQVLENFKPMYLQEKSKL